ncbi:hypothetical protein GDO81_000454 [Engystomops pustulosus]|uniref:Uncharacterized protein n=1 Tax=Engystomops pustulosus TaxID=76066 RepID=A0AAV7D6K1_ENGPU|nr:hypothetical protein GDO81_000454 [Engystomops pustulosus]
MRHEFGMTHMILLLYSLLLFLKISQVKGSTPHSNLNPTDIATVQDEQTDDSIGNTIAMLSHPQANTIPAPVVNLTENPQSRIGMNVTTEIYKKTSSSVLHGNKHTEESPTKDIPELTTQDKSTNKHGTKQSESQTNGNV